jgi:hypothetical protein
LRFISGRLIIGLAVLTVGVLLLLNNLGIGIEIEIRQVLRLWPVIFLILGINWLILSFGSTASEAGRKVFFSWGQFLTALVFIAFGAVFLGRNLGLFKVDLSIIFNLLWPVILILVGFSLLRGRSQSGGSGGRLVVMGGTKVGGEQPWKLESGSYFALMGSIEIDLTAAEIETGETLLDLTAIMGGIEVRIPSDLAVIYDGSAILGGVTFKDQEDGGIVGGRRVEQNIASDADKIVRIQARAIMGGVEIK